MTPIAPDFVPLTRPAAAPAVPEGFALVPVEPTPEMLNAGMTALFDRKHPRAPWEDCIADMFTAMLAAAQAKGAGHD